MDCSVLKHMVQPLCPLRLRAVVVGHMFAPSYVPKGKLIRLLSLRREAARGRGRSLYLSGGKHDKKTPTGSRSWLERNLSWVGL